MADEAANSPNPFDVETIRQLVALMSEHDLSEVSLRQGKASLRLRRGALVSGVAVPAPIVPAAHTAPSPAAPPAAAPAAFRPVSPIKSPTPGTFYDREKPDAKPYVEVGSRVTPSTVVGLIEAMKIFNEIQAECSGVIVRALVENGQPVEYGTVLFEVDPTG
ncbi:MAG: acetyl-CoA carboxylase biotin carboxyl carrier protein [Planctomycetes bacterium]|nr:acetyl-CoA carboxylase biotin carboxyl carrier protein [Planctomycetota bacterium]